MLTDALGATAQAYTDAMLADGCPYLTNGRIVLRPMPTGDQGLWI